MSRARMIVRRGAWWLAGALVAIQAVPYGRRHANPPVVQEPRWNAPRTRELFFRVCKDCHSNQTAWPWYSWVAPASWLVQSDVEEARAQFNVSEWNRPDQEGYQAADLLKHGWMPPKLYRIAHGTARLGPGDKNDLVAGFAATFGTQRPRGPHHVERNPERE